MSVQSSRRKGYRSAELCRAYDEKVERGNVPDRDPLHEYCLKWICLIVFARPKELQLVARGHGRFSIVTARSAKPTVGRQCQLCHQ